MDEHKITWCKCTTDKKSKLKLLDRRIESLEDDIAKAKAECNKKLRGLNNKRKDLMKERRPLLPKKKKDDSYF